MAMPTFLVIGAMKCGTGALHLYLRQHPQVFMRRKGPHYFAFVGARPRFAGPQSGLNNAITDRGDYERLFAPGEGYPARGEASWTSMYVPEAAERIRRELPDARLIAVIRHPAERAYSGYLHTRLYGREPAATFEEALALEPERIRENWPYPWRYRDLGYYGRQLERFFATFPRERIRVYLQEDLRRDSLAVIRDAYAFVGVDPSFAPDVSVRPNATGVPRGPLVRAATAASRPLRKLMRRTLPVAMHKRLRAAVARGALERPKLDPAVRARLTEEYVDDIRLLERLIERDLSNWLAGPAA